MVLRGNFSIKLVHITIRIWSLSTVCSGFIITGAYVQYHVLSQRRQVVDLPEVYLGLLHRLHTGVDGSHQSLLRWTLNIHKDNTAHLEQPLVWLLYTSTIHHTGTFCCSYQWWHVSTVHLTHRDLLLSRGHGAHAKRLGANGARADHPRQRHRTVLRPAHTVKLLLEDGGPAGTQNSSSYSVYFKTSCLFHLISSYQEATRSMSKHLKMCGSRSARHMSSTKIKCMNIQYGVLDVENHPKMQSANTEA